MRSRTALVSLAATLGLTGVVAACGSDGGPSSADAGPSEAGAGDATLNDSSSDVDGAVPGFDAPPEAEPTSDAAVDAADASVCLPPAGDAAVVDFAVPSVDGGSAAQPLRIARGPDGEVWFTESNAARLVRTDATGVMTQVPLLAQSSPASGITVGPDGALWFTEPAARKVGRVSEDGGITELALAASDGGTMVPIEIATGPDGNLWITLLGDVVARVTPAGVATAFDVSVDAGALEPSVIVAGPDGNLWFASAGLPMISRITTAGVVTHYGVSGRSFGVAAGADGALWFTTTQGLGRITFAPEPTITEFGVAGTRPAEIIAGPDCVSLYVADSLGNRVRRFTPPPASAGDDAGLSFIDFDVPTANADVESLTIGPGASVWFVEVGAARVGFFQP
jgi:virginiamycin B lyase